MSSSKNPLSWPRSGGGIRVGYELRVADEGLGRMRTLLSKVSQISQTVIHVNIFCNRFDESIL